MKVLFLDIDGVLNAFTRNGRDQLEFSNGETIDCRKVALLSEIVKSSGAKLVLHSGWRFWFDDTMRPLRPEAVMLARIFQQAQLTITDKTPDFATDTIRQTKRFSLVKAKEIRAWLEAHPQITRFVIVEDLDLGDAALADYQIRPDSAVGLTRQEAEAAIRILNHP